MADTDLGPLVLTETVAKEIMRELHRLFVLYTENIHLHGSEFALQILIIPRAGEKIILPDGDQDWRMTKDKFEILKDS